VSRRRRDGVKRRVAIAAQKYFRSGIAGTIARPRPSALASPGDP